MEKSYLKIKENMTQRAMELWGVEDKRLIDPVIDLLLDIFSYELSKIEQDIKISDSKLLERISKILVKESWSLPSPAHALLRAMPSNGSTKINRNTQFYVQKLIQGEKYIDIFFTPLIEHQLINGHVSCIIKHQTANFFNKAGQNQFELSLKGDMRIKDYTLWIGIDIDNNLLQELSELPLALILRDSKFDTYLKLIKFSDSEGNEIKHKSSLADTKGMAKEHYFDSVMRYYQNYMYTVILASNRSKQSLLEKFGAYFFTEEIEDYNKKLFWLKIDFPVTFTKPELDRISVQMNTFPIVNRKLQYKQHNIKRNGKIISLGTLDEYFLNLEDLFDDEGRYYNNTLDNDINDLRGTYSLYFGKLGQFDERNAKEVLEKVIHTVREEGSSFSAIGYDLLNAYLEDLNSKLDFIERKVKMGYKNIIKESNRQFLLTIPYEDSTYLECQFWIADADEANNIPAGHSIRQFETSEFMPQSLKLQTDTVGGRDKNNSKEKISNLRYGLLSKDRIVSIEDVKEFIKKNVGKTVNRVEVNSGVGISPTKSGGLIRTTQVDVYLLNSKIHTNENKKRLSNSLQLELEQKSVHNLPYIVTIH